MGIEDLTQTLCEELARLPVESRVAALNSVRRALHAVSPLRAEPVDLVEWVPAGIVRANDWNPNTVAPPEMDLLIHSVRCDGYTQPVVAWPEAGLYEVVDGFHRYRVGTEAGDIRVRLSGFLPVVSIRGERGERGDRMAATIRHNRARGRHSVEGMARIVVELVRRGWADAKIGSELGMDPDEVLRLKQVTGLAELFARNEFSTAWEAGDDGEA